MKLMGLIDKMLARYSSDFVIVREFLQNADDAGAAQVHIKFQTNKSGGVTYVKIANNGRAFTAADWKRVASIAEGNPDADVSSTFCSVSAYVSTMLPSSLLCLLVVDLLLTPTCAGCRHVWSGILQCLLNF